MKTLETCQRKKFNSSSEQLNFLSTNSKPPVPEGFEMFQDDEKGFFMINTQDGSLFKWIDVRTLKCNGITETGKKSQYGRRNFDGLLGESKFNKRYYHETSDTNFKTCVEKFGGFYSSVFRARYNGNGLISYSGKGKLVDCITSEESRKSARSYMIKYRKARDYTSDLPCGAAMDCLFEYSYEQFEKEVLTITEKGERKYDAWNRYEKTISFKENGVYGIHDLVAKGAELTTEAYASAEYHVVVRGGARGLFLISYYDDEKESFEKGETNIYFELGSRNFISKQAKFRDYGYRLMLLPE